MVVLALIMFVMVILAAEILARIILSLVLLMMVILAFIVLAIVILAMGLLLFTIAILTIVILIIVISTPFTRERIEIGSKTIRIVLIRSIFIIAFTRDRIRNCLRLHGTRSIWIRSEFIRSAHVLIGKKPLAHFLLWLCVCSVLIFVCFSV